MLFSNYAFQYFDWWHDQIIDAYQPGTDIPEGFEHNGLFKNNILNLGFTIGLNDYWNATLTQSISKRCMVWDGPVDNDGNSLTVHHRTECSSTDFYDGENRIAFGGVLGDTRLNFRYLLYNQMKGPGSRVFIGMGLDIPSKNVITESPWLKSDHDGNPSTPSRYTPHRHFYLSDGAYKINLELQFFKKRMQFPVFWGGTFAFNFPLNDSEYGFSPSRRYQISLLAMSSSRLFKSIRLGKFSLGSIGPTLTIAHAGRSQWEGQEETPNSKSILYLPGINILISSDSGGGLGINIARGFEHYINDSQSDIKEKTDIYSISINYRTVLSQRIDWLW
mgnify:CR=1 FL=1|tara:strand:- start:2279 stop:3277 length:999 start_codon:yes stop_codon:yes gene_type:complete